jgi:hypothetical protein
MISIVCILNENNIKKQKEFNYKHNKNTLFRILGDSLFKNKNKEDKIGPKFKI